MATGLRQRPSSGSEVDMIDPELALAADAGTDVARQSPSGPADRSGREPGERRLIGGLVANNVLFAVAIVLVIAAALSVQPIRAVR
jgi:hypothetical protein